MALTGLSYVYQPLKGDRDIRLLRLECGRYSDDLRCSLSIVHLDDEPVYEAVSYAWGETIPSTSLLCSGRSLPITQNLSDALRRLRYSDRPWTGWIDAVCVNQRNLLERGRQVQLMRDVFRGAKQVVIWLGEEAADAHLVFTAISRYKEKFQNYSGPNRSETSFSWQFTGDEQWALFTQFGERAWFTRLWVVQEVAWACRASVVCGQLVVDWQLFSAALCDVKFDNTSVSDLAQFSVISIRNITSTSKSIVQGATERSSEGERSLAELVSRYRHCYATDPRDKIFALLGLRASLPAAAFPVDYTKSTAAVYKDFALYVMREEANIDILSASCHPSPGTSCVTLPSWVPDWTKTSRSYPGTTVFGNYYHAATDVVCSFRLGEDPNMLLVDGLLMSQVAHVCRDWVLSTYGNLEKELYPGESPGKLVDALELQVHALKEAMLTAASSQIYGGKAALRRNFVLALTGYSNRNKYTTANLEADAVILYDGYLSWMKKFLEAIRDRRDFRNDPELVVTDEMDEFALAIGFKPFHHRFCRFSDGRLGYVPEEAALGDQIAIFLGASTPFLLRPHGDAYIIVGEIYVYKMMDGEALKDPHLQVETIKLV
ncbi:hypothetical protein MMC18_006651 [Xylographa bjoerkii]|nr:hypothetical protein [Xylographa bjoerkii]